MLVQQHVLKHTSTAAAIRDSAPWISFAFSAKLEEEAHVWIHGTLQM
jgi:hypothetical protein